MSVDTPSGANSTVLELRVSDESLMNGSSGSVYLTRAQCNELNLLTGSQAYVQNDDGDFFNGPVRNPPPTVSPDDGEIVLTAVQKSLLGVSAGDTVRIGRHSKTSSSSSSTTSSTTSTSRSSSRQAAQQRSSATEETNEALEAATEEVEINDVTYDDIGGLDDEVDSIKEMVELPLKRPELFTEYGVDPPSGVLLHGPPGTGKTMIAKAISNEADARFLSIDGPEIISKYKGESEKQLRQIFEEARQNGPSIIFFDEIDAIAGEREEDSDAESRLVGQLLSLMDGVGAQENIIVIGATNRVDTLDNALRRGGRFDRELEIGVPDEQGRREILEIHTEDMPLGEDVSVDSIAERTHGFVGADLAALSREAAMYALNRARREDLDEDERVVTTEDFNRALSDVDPSAMREFVAEEPTTTFDEVGGLETEKRTLKQNVEWPLQYARMFEVTDTDPPNGVVLHGPPGSGKTLLARALAGESEINFIQVDSTSLMDKYVGESEKTIREVFQRARQAAPSVVFLDNIGAVASTGMMTGDGASAEVTERMVSQLLTELDSLQDNPNVTVIAATEDIEDVDDRLLQPNRFEERIELSLPDEEAREEILQIHSGGKPFADDVDMDELVDRLEGYTGSEIESVVRRASMESIYRTVQERGVEEANENAEDIEITWADFRIALDAVLDE